MKPKIKKIDARKKCKAQDILPQLESGNKESSENACSLSLPIDVNDLPATETKSLENTVKEEAVKIDDKVSNVLLIGDLVWSRIPGHCWWPSMVSYDPNSAVYFQKSGNKKTGGALKFHVQFFGDEALRGWVTKSNVVRFLGRNHFMNLSSSILGNKARFPQSTRKDSWDHAITQAEAALLLSRHERKLAYVYSYFDQGKVSGNLKSTKQTKSASKKNIKTTFTKVSSSVVQGRSLLNVTKSGNSIKQHQDKSNLKIPNAANETLAKQKVETNKTLPVIDDHKKRPFTEQNLNILSPRAHENSSDSGIEDIGDNFLENDMLEEPQCIMEMSGSKRKRKQKQYDDFHMGSEIETAIKYGISRPVRNKKSKSASGMETRNKKSNVIIPMKKGLDDLASCIASDLGNKNTDIAAKKEKQMMDYQQEDFLITNKQTIDSLSDDKVCPTAILNITSNVIEKSPVEQKPSMKKSVKRKGETGQGANKKQKIVKSVESDLVKDSSCGQESPDDVNIKRRLDVKDMFCALCEETSGELIPCHGDCFNSFHLDCLGLTCTPKTDFICDECQTGCHTCFHCKQAGDLIKCVQASCGKFYHSSCIQSLQELKSDGKASSKFYCPHHTCKYCFHQPKSSQNVTNNRKLLKCIRCPVAYHQSTCFVAGCFPLTPHNMICDNHFEADLKLKNQNHVNVNWCFVCSSGGSLVCCDTCPASFHRECIDNYQDDPNGTWQCQDCREHKKLRYGDIVWVKFGVYKWWPGKICLPNEIPERIQNLPHVLAQFPVLFFGSRDYAWLHSGRVFCYEEGDKGGSLPGNRCLAQHFQKALCEAATAYAELKQERTLQAEVMDRKKSNKPPPFKTIKANRPVTCIRTILDQSEWPICECQPSYPCHGESECLNRILLFECNPKTCPAGDQCQNQRIQRNQHVKCAPFRCDSRGWGLKAEQDIKSGEFVIEYVGELIDEDTCHKRIKHYHENDVLDYYFLTIDRDNIIDAYPKGNLSRFMNHSCDPNCETQKWTVNGEVRVGLFANRDIAVGDEVCFNYNLDCLGNEKKQCKCGAANCSGFLGVQPKTQHSMSVAEKAKNKEQKEKEKRKMKREKSKLQKIVHEDECFICGDGGELILCSRGKCTKSYHVSCLDIDKKPYGRWECPWHFCDSCGKVAKHMCLLCPNSFCDSHQESEIISLQDGISVCVDHDEDECDALLIKLKGESDEVLPAAEDSMEKTDRDKDEVIRKKVKNLKKTKINKGNSKHSKTSEKHLSKRKTINRGRMETSKEIPSDVKHSAHNEKMRSVSATKKSVSRKDGRKDLSKQTKRNTQR